VKKQEILEPTNLIFSFHLSTLRSCLSYPVRCDINHGVLLTCSLIHSLATIIFFSFLPAPMEATVCPGRITGKMATFVFVLRFAAMVSQVGRQGKKSRFALQSDPVKQNQKIRDVCLGCH
ncbi:uncharacterized protein PgNI_03429, partial [Pyricularia grisea]|uniref:Uncharacterized protein n=1 Tax=Pyricularia grisea TaxID=148305 RepID=A0A6P8BDB1_PYRGI